jgi:hypothetical protein
MAKTWVDPHGGSAAARRLSSTAVGRGHGQRGERGAARGCPIGADLRHPPRRASPRRHHDRRIHRSAPSSTVCIPPQLDLPPPGANNAAVRWRTCSRAYSAAPTIGC